MTYCEEWQNRPLWRGRPPTRKIFSRFYRKCSITFKWLFFSEKFVNRFSRWKKKIRYCRPRTFGTMVIHPLEWDLSIFAKWSARKVKKKITIRETIILFQKKKSEEFNTFSILEHFEGMKFWNFFPLIFRNVGIECLIISELLKGPK